VSDAERTPRTAERGTPALDVRVVAGGPLDAVEESALVLAVRQVMTAREGRRVHGGSTWGRAGRLEALYGRRITAPSGLTDVSDTATS
jgi:hypothetical protein